MKLISVDASPFVRKVRILILELGLQDSVELVDPGSVTPISNNITLNAINPLGMLPALELDIVEPNPGPKESPDYICSTRFERKPGMSFTSSAMLPFVRSNSLTHPRKRHGFKTPD